MVLLSGINILKQCATVFTLVCSEFGGMWSMGDEADIISAIVKGNVDISTVSMHYVLTSQVEDLKVWRNGMDYTWVIMGSEPE